MVKDKIATTKLDVALSLLGSYIKNHELRHTKERAAILDAAFRIKSPFDVEDIRVYMAKNKMPVSAGTAYNTLLLLFKAKILSRARSTSKSMRFVLNDLERPASYAICMRCGKTKPFKDSSLTRALNHLNIKGFHRDHYTVLIYGLCETCFQESQTKQQTE